MLAVFDIQYSMPKERTISNTGESAATEHGPRDRQNVSYERSSRPPHLGGLAAHESPAWDFLDLSDLRIGSAVGPTRDFGLVPID